MADVNESALMPDFDERAAQVAGLGAADLSVPSHEAAPMFPNHLLAALKVVTEGLPAQQAVGSAHGPVKANGAPVAP